MLDIHIITYDAHSGAASQAQERGIVALGSYYRVSQKFVTLLYKSVFQYDWPKKFFGDRAFPLSQGLDDRAPSLSQAESGSGTSKCAVSEREICLKIKKNEI